MAKFEIKISGIMNTEYIFEGSEKDLWAWLKEKFDDIEWFTVTKKKVYKLSGFEVVEKYWDASMKNGRISRELIFDANRTGASE